LPSATSRWTNAYARDPAHFLLSASLVALLLWLSASLKSRITDQMRTAWRTSLSKYDVHADENTTTGRADVVKWLLYAGLIFVVLYPVPAFFGFPLPRIGGSPQMLIDRITVFHFWFFAVAVLITMFLSDSMIASFRLKYGYRKAISNIRLWIAPAIFAVIFLVGGLALAGHYVFDIRDSFGHFCKPDPEAKPLIKDVCSADAQKSCTRVNGDLVGCSEACRGKESEFDTSRLCNSTGVIVKRGERYRFEITKKDDWQCLGGASGPGGALLPQKSQSLGDAAYTWGRWAALAILYPLKRTFDRPFGRVFIRYGETGNEENFIDPDEEKLDTDTLEETFKPTRDGELYVYLNNPVSGFWPGLFQDMGVNSGTAKVRVYRVPRPQ